MKPEILVLAPLYEPALAELERQYTVRRLWEAEDSESFMTEHCAQVRGLVTTGLAGFTRSHIAHLPRLEIIACFGVGHDTVDLPAAKERGIVVTHTASGTAASVADLATGLLINIMRRIGESERFVRAGKWPAAPPLPGREIGGKVCGIVGMGEIGRRIATRVEAFGMSVCYHGPRPKEDLAYAYYPSLRSMARQSDCLVVACPSTPGTRGMVDARILEALGPEGFLVNVARGAIVDEHALICALQERRIAGAALDVYWDEPRVPPALMALENVLLVPHIGSSTLDLREERKEKLLANLRAHFNGGAAER